MAMRNPINKVDPDLKGSPAVSAKKAVQAEEANDDVQDMGPTTTPGMEDAAGHGGKKGMKARGKVVAIIAAFRGAGQVPGKGSNPKPTVQKKG
jgi:hypothetical protein